MKITLTIPSQSFSSADFPNRFPEIKSRSLIIKREDLICTKDDKNEMYEYDLVHYRSLDELRVSIDCEYILKKEVFFSWSFTLPSRGLTVTVDYPAQFELSVQTFGMEEEDLHVKDEGGLYSMHYGSWVLPNSGLVCQLRAKNNERSVLVPTEKKVEVSQVNGETE